MVAFILFSPVFTVYVARLSDIFQLSLALLPRSHFLSKLFYQIFTIV